MNLFFNLLVNSPIYLSEKGVISLNIFNETYENSSICDYLKLDEEKYQFYQKEIVGFYVLNKLIGFRSKNNNTYKKNEIYATSLYNKLDINWLNVSNKLKAFKLEQIQNKIETEIQEHISENDGIYENEVEDIKLRVIEKSDLNPNYSSFLSFIKNPQESIEVILPEMMDNFESLIKEYNELSDIDNKLLNNYTVELYITEQIDNISNLIRIISEEISE